MRIECEACHELVDARFAIDGNTVVATCPRCDATTTVRDEPAPEPAPKPELPREVCPKCGHARADAPACPTCGLATDKIDSFIAARDAAVPDLVRATWQRATEAWTDPARHDAVFRVVSEHGCFAWAAAMYRDACTLRGDDVSKQQLERIRKGAEVMLFATRTQPARNGVLRGVLIVLVALMICFVVYLALMLSRHPADDDDDGAPPAGQVR